MPELPDVENFRRFLNRTANHHTIERVDIRDTLILRGASRRSFQAHVSGKKIARTVRHGKHLFAALESGFVAFHFGMTGYLQSFLRQELESEYNRVIFHLNNGVHIAFNCRRRLGSIRYVEDLEQFITRHRLGPDALRIDLQSFLSRLEVKKGSIKCVLMDQSVLSGIGNIYADEILFQARLHPQTALSAIAEDDKRTLFKAMHRVLKAAVANNANSSRFPWRYLTHHRSPGSLCPRCRTQIATTRACGRTAYFCPKEQRERS